MAQVDRAAIEQAQSVIFDEGMKIREQVLGSEHVQASRAMPDLLQPVQQLAVSAGWGMCWTRPGLEPRVRSLITIALLTSMSQDHEVPLHTKGALRNGCTPEEVMECIFQAGVYAGAPRAINASRLAYEAMQEAGKA